MAKTAFFSIMIINYLPYLFINLYTQARFPLILKTYMSQAKLVRNSEQEQRFALIAAAGSSASAVLQHTAWILGM